MKFLPKALFISHGGGPLPLLGHPGHNEMVACLRQIAADLPRPAAIVVVSAHWEEAVPTITAAANPPLIYDYYGFPPESYEIQYPCPGEPELANDIYRMLSAQGIEARLDASRGFDHGVFVPLKIMYPEANIPCVQLSLVRNLDPLLHIEIGAALQALTDRNVLVIGSGFSFHSIDEFFSPNTLESSEKNQAFEQWLQNLCTNPELSEQQRKEMLLHWSEAPGARFCHPREEHLVPLFVCYGLAQSASRKMWEVNIMNKNSSMYLW